MVIAPNPAFASSSWYMSRDAVAVASCSGECVKIAERYCVPRSLPCWFFVVGSWILKNHFASSSS